MIPFLWSSEYMMIILSVLFVIYQRSVYTMYKIMYIVCLRNVSFIS